MNDMAYYVKQYMQVTNELEITSILCQILIVFHQHQPQIKKKKKKDAKRDVSRGPTNIKYLQ